MMCTSKNYSVFVIFMILGTALLVNAKKVTKPPKICKTPLKSITAKIPDYIETLENALPQGYKAYVNADIPRGAISPLLVYATNHSSPFSKLPDISNVNCSKPTLIFVNVFHSPEYKVLKALAYLQKQRKDYNVIILNFASNSIQMYNTIKNNFKDHGYLVYKLIKSLTECGCKNDRIIMAGHGHGAQIAALAAKLYTKYTKDHPQLGLLLALDPAPAPIENLYVNKTVCKKVVVIHGESLVGLGTEKPIGNIDIYLNSPNGQPGCMDSVCNHVFPIYALVEAATKHKMLGVNCPNYETFKNGKCDYYNILRIGLEYPGDCHGKYYLQTKANYPRAMGSNGLGCPKNFK